MNKIQTFQQFLASQSVQVPVFDFLINLIIAVILGYILNIVYIRFGKSVSNRRMFAKIFPLLTLSTMIVITIVKSSLALSLGLVGALSIVRFRTAIKEPEELSYLFFSICIGLGLGADQTTTTIIGFVAFIIIVMIRGTYSAKEENNNLILNVSLQEPREASLTDIIQVVTEKTYSAFMKRFDEDAERLEATFVVDFKDITALDKCKKSLQELDSKISITIMDNKGII